jgi:GNAT superfamily N-acetyltransferase
MSSSVITDHSLACRLELAEALANARFVDTRASIMPDSGAKWIEVAGAYAMFDGPHSPCTQTFGLGLFQMPVASDMDKLEAFFKECGAPVIHEVCPLANKTLLPMLNQRGYRPVELTQVMFLPLSKEALPVSVRNEALQVRVAHEEERELWAQTSAEGWRELDEIGDGLRDLTRVSAANQHTVLFLAELHGHPIASGALATHKGVALLAGASTIPEWRGRGAQRALLESRLQYAQRLGCDLAMICAEPGSSSQRNSERQGFYTAYTRIKWSLAIS